MNQYDSLSGVQAQHRQIAIGRLERFLGGHGFSGPALPLSNRIAASDQTPVKSKYRAFGVAQSALDALRSGPAQGEQIVVATLTGHQAIEAWVKEWLKKIQEHIPDKQMTPQHIIGARLGQMVPMSTSVIALAALWPMSWEAFFDLPWTAVLGSIGLASIIDTQIFENRSSMNGAMRELLGHVASSPSQLKPSWIYLGWLSRVSAFDIQVAQGSEVSLDSPVWPALGEHGARVTLYAPFMALFQRIQGTAFSSFWNSWRRLTKTTNIQVNLFFQIDELGTPEMTLIARVGTKRARPTGPRKKDETLEPEFEQIPDIVTASGN